MIGQSAGKSFAYLLGVYLGDGCVTAVMHKAKDKRYKRFRLNTIDRDFAEATARAVKAVTGIENPIHGPYQDKRFPNSAPQYMFCSSNVDLCEQLETETDKKAKIPEWIFTADKDIRLEFIAGLMDSEGYVAARTSYPTNRKYFMGFKSCDKWVRDFARLLEETGIRIGDIRTEKPLKSHYKIPTVFKIKMRSWVDSGAFFKCSRKQKRVVEWDSVAPYAKTSLNEHTSGTATS